MTSYTVDLCNGFVKVGEASSLEFQAIVRNLAAGEFELQAPINALELASTADVDSIDSIVVVNDRGRVDFSGILRHAGGVTPGREVRSTSEGSFLKLSGVDLFGFLGVREVWPTPATEAPWVDSHDERTGVGSSVARDYILYHMGNLAREERQVPIVFTVDPIVGTSSTWSFRLQPLDEVVGRVCRESGALCRPRMTADREIEYVFSSPTDLSGSLILSDQGDLDGLTRLFTPAEATHVVAAGQGDLELRAFYPAGTGAAGLDRTERTYEASNVTTLTGLERAARTQLVLQGEDVSVDVDLGPDLANRFRYRDEYDIGDWIGVEIAGVRDSAQVEAVTFSLTQEEQVVTPVLGRRASSAAIQLLRDVEDLQSRFGRSVS